MKDINLKNYKHPFIISATKGSLVSLAVSLIGILIFAFFLRFLTIPDSAISPVVSIVKGVSILLGVLYGMKNVKEMGIITGLVIGLSYVILSFVCFSILDGFSFEFSKTLLNDIIFGSIIGAISGIIAVNIKKK